MTITATLNDNDAVKVHFTDVRAPRVTGRTDHITFVTPDVADELGCAIFDALRNDIPTIIKPYPHEPEYFAVTPGEDVVVVHHVLSARDAVLFEAVLERDEAATSADSLVAPKWLLENTY